MLTAVRDKEGRVKAICRPASFIVTKDKVFWSRLTDSHSEIVEEHKLHADGVRGPNIAKVEIVPPGEDYRLPLDQWVFKVDENVTPVWLDVAETEAMIRAELPNWLAAKVMLPDEKRIEHKDGLIVACYGTIQYVRGGTIEYVRGGTIEYVYGGTIQSVRGGTIEYVDGGTIQYVYGGTIEYVDGGTIQSVRGGTIQSVRGGTIQYVYGVANVTTYISLPRPTEQAVIVDRSGDVVRCVVAKKTRVKKTV